jgi:hypothetical protein
MITALMPGVNVRIMSIKSVAAAVLALLTLSSHLLADEPVTTLVPTTLSSDIFTGQPYPQGLRVVTIYGGYAAQPTGEREQLGFTNVGLNYYFANNWAFGFEATGVGVSQDVNNAAAGGADIILRTHLWNYGRFSLYGDFTAGVLEADQRVPPGGTDFNFTIRTGVGSAYRLTETTSLMLGVRYWHLSNARQEGPNRNPSLNAIEGYIGLMFRM